LSKNILVVGFTFILGYSSLSSLIAQNTVNVNSVQTELQLNTITTAVPFMMISPDSRSGGLGDAGVSTSPDAFSMHWNPSKLAFIEGSGGVSMSYSPWLRNLVGDISLSYVTGYFRLSKIATLGTSLRYFSLGDITFTDVNGGVIGNFKPNEFAFDVAYAMQLSTNLSFGVSLRYINSNLTNGVTVDNNATKPGQSIAADISAYYFSDKFKLGDYDATFGAGMNISNIGNKMSYTDNQDNDFLPTNLRLGPSLKLDFDDYNSMTFLIEANKLLVPTPALFLTDSTGTVVRDAGGNPVVVSGRDPNVSVVNGIVGSFSDAPGVVTGFNSDGSPIVESGSVLREELREITLSAGVEYWYDKQFAVRLGYFYESPLKGNRQYLTVGLGLKLSVFGMDISYLAGNAQQNPLANTVRFSLRFNFDDFNQQNERN
tara:strand:+ start:3846 stop:5132 length:1287 start_codon:yes stop_codon:yes gene_type:complete